MEFIPDSTSQQRVQVPFFEDARAEDGWEGQTTRKTVRELERELATTLTRLGGGITGIKWGRFNDGETVREGCHLNFVLQRDNGAMDAARMPLAALPCRGPNRASKTRGVSNAEASRRMMLFMLNRAFSGLWFVQQMSPGYVPLMPFLLVGDTGKTITQLYSEQGMFSALLPSPDAQFIEGEIVG
jgi:hypothetical protein